MACSRTLLHCRPKAGSAADTDSGVSRTRVATDLQSDRDCSHVLEYAAGVPRWSAHGSVIGRRCSRDRTVRVVADHRLSVIRGPLIAEESARSCTSMCSTGIECLVHELRAAASDGLPHLEIRRAADPSLACPRLRKARRPARAPASTAAAESKVRSRASGGLSGAGFIRNRIATSSSIARPMLSWFEAAMSRQMSAGLDARRVVSRRPRPASASPSAPGVLSDDVHQGAGGELGKMTEICDERIVRIRRHGLDVRADRLDQHRQARGRLLGRVAVRRQDPGPAVEQIGRWPPEARRPQHRQAGARRRMQGATAGRATAETMSRLVLPTSVTMASPGT